MERSRQSFQIHKKKNQLSTEKDKEEIRNKETHPFEKRPLLS
jgi:hypothetical protein